MDCSDCLECLVSSDASVDTNMQTFSNRCINLNDQICKPCSSQACAHTRPTQAGPETHKKVCYTCSSYVKSATLPRSRRCKHIAHTGYQGDPRLMGGNPRWWEELEDNLQSADFDWNALSPDEVDDRIEEAAAFISVLEDLQPLDPRSTNMFAEVWKRLARVPPKARIRLLHELDQGSIRSLWKASMSRYILSDSLAMQLLGDFSILDDFPSQPGEVVTYEGCAEQWFFVEPDTKFSVDKAMQDRYPRSQPWLRPNQSRLKSRQTRFKQHFFLHPRTGVLFSRVELPFLGPIPNWWTPMYCRVRPSLTLTPLDSDAGADMTFDYQKIPEPGDQPPPPAPEIVLDDGSEQTIDAALGLTAAQQAALLAELLPPDLPVEGWPSPAAGMLSPFSSTPRDFVRVAGPGVYVGCAYPKDSRGTVLKETCIYFLLVRTP